MNRELAPCGTPAAARRHYRRGEPLDIACREANARDTAERLQRSHEYVTRFVDRREIRNGVPFKPYVYNGSGADAFTGEVVVL